VHAGGLRVINRLPAGEADGIFFGLDIEIFLIDTRQLDNGYEVVAL
jgi:hypothetical protein